MKYRTISGSVTVTAWPFRIWRVITGMTLPRLPSTFPKRTLTMFAFLATA